MSFLSYTCPYLYLMEERAREFKDLQIYLQFVPEKKFFFFFLN